MGTSDNLIMSTYHDESKSCALIDYYVDEWKYISSIDMGMFEYVRFIIFEELQGLALSVATMWLDMLYLI